MIAAKADATFMRLDDNVVYFSINPTVEHIRKDTIFRPLDIHLDETNMSQLADEVH